MFHSFGICESGHMKKTAHFFLNRLCLCALAVLSTLGAGALVFQAPSVLADDDDWRKLHEEVLAGHIKPLREILESLERDWQGQVIDVDIETEDGRRLYEIEMLGPQGQVVVFEIDAVTGELMGMEGSNIDSMRRR